MIDTKIVIRKFAARGVIETKCYYKYFESVDHIHRFINKFCALHDIGYDRIIKNDYCMVIYPADRDFDTRENIHVIQK